MQTVRCELDASSDHMKTKIANAEQMKVHTMLVTGNRDIEANAGSLRVHGGLRLCLSRGLRIAS